MDQIFTSKVERLGLYVCNLYKWIIFTDLYWSKFLILPEDPIFPEDPSAQQKKMRDLCSVAVVKNEDTLLQTMHSLYAVMMLLCDHTMKYKVSNHKDHERSSILGTHWVYRRLSNSWWDQMKVNGHEFILSQFNEITNSIKIASTGSAILKCILQISISLAFKYCELICP